MGGRDRRTEKKRDKEREREREREFNSKTLFYKDCSLGSVKTCLTTSTCYATNEREREREREREAGRQAERDRDTKRERGGGGDLCLYNCTVCIASSCLQRTWLSNRVVRARAVLWASSSVRFGTHSPYYCIPMQRGAYWDIPFIRNGYTSPRLAS